jgi:hypothetical protein
MSGTREALIPRARNVIGVEQYPSFSEVVLQVAPIFRESPWSPTFPQPTG